MLKNLKQRLIDYTESLTTYDYAAFGWLLFLLVTLILLAIILSKKKPKLASFFIFVTFIMMFIAPIGLKIFLDETIRKVEIVDQNHTALQFSKALVITGSVENKGKIDFNKCYIKTNIIKVSDNKYKNIFNYLKPIRKRTIILDEQISQNQSKEFKVVFEKFNYPKEYTVTVSAECY